MEISRKAIWTGFVSSAVPVLFLLFDAIAKLVRPPLFSHVLFPIYVAAFLWAGLWLRDRRLREVL